MIRIKLCSMGITDIMMMMLKKKERKTGFVSESDNDSLLFQFHVQLSDQTTSDSFSFLHITDINI